MGIKNLESLKNEFGNENFMLQTVKKFQVEVPCSIFDEFARGIKEKNNQFLNSMLQPRS